MTDATVLDAPASMTALAKDLPPIQFNGAARLVVAPNVLKELAERAVLTERLDGPRFGGLPVTSSAVLAWGWAIGFNMQDEMVWSNRFDVRAARPA